MTMMRILAALTATALPPATLVVSYWLIVVLTTRTGPSAQLREVVGYVGLAVISVALCLVLGVAGRALSRFPVAARLGMAGGWFLLGANMFLLLAFSFVPTTPPWTSWGSFDMFVGLLGTPLVFATAMSNYTVGVAVRSRWRRRSSVVALSFVPGILLAVYGCLCPWA